MAVSKKQAQTKSRAQLVNNIIKIKLQCILICSKVGAVKRTQKPTVLQLHAI